jgi:uncharacterized protein YbjT (DUF2867 family)
MPDPAQGLTNPIDENGHFQAQFGGTPEFGRKTASVGRQALNESAKSAKMETYAPGSLQTPAPRASRTQRCLLAPLAARTYLRATSMKGNPMFVVTGATGKTGGGIAEKLLKDGKKVRAIGRNREKLAALEKQGAEIAVGNMEDAVFLAKSFVGAEAVFAMIPPDLAAPDIHAYYDRFGAATAKALAESGVRYVVHLSSVGADMPKGNGPVAGLYRQEQRLNALSGVNVLHLRPGYFMENQYGNIPMIKGMGINGSPLKPDLKFPQIATRDIAAHGALRMEKKDFSGKVVQDLLGPRDLSMQEATAAIGKAIGKPDLPYVQFSYEDALKAMVGGGLSRSVAESFVEMNKGFNEGLITKPARNAANSTPTDVEEFAKQFARVFQG